MISRISSSFKMPKACWWSELRFDPLRIASNQLEPVSVTLRKKLRKNPRWIEGHLHLAWVSLRRFEEGSSPQKLRYLFTCRLSAQAVLELKGVDFILSPENLLTTDCDSMSLQAFGLLGVCDHFEKNYLSAFNCLYSISRAARQIPASQGERLVKLIDYGAASALVLERFDEAEAMLQILPEIERSAEGREVLKYLNWRKSGGDSA